MYEIILKMAPHDRHYALLEISPDQMYEGIHDGCFPVALLELWVQARENQALALQYL